MRSMVYPLNIATFECEPLGQTIDTLIDFANWIPKNSPTITESNVFEYVWIERQVQIDAVNRLEDHKQTVICFFLVAQKHPSSPHLPPNQETVDPGL